MVFSGQDLTRRIFENIIGRGVLYNYRPNFMKNPKSGSNLELDIYDPILKIAIEYNGKQHYFERYHPNELSFRKLVDRDLIKLELCKKNNIKLIVIPYTLSLTKDREIYIREFIMESLKDHCKF